MVIVRNIHEKSPKTKVLLLGVFPRADRKTGELVKKIDEINGMTKFASGIYLIAKGLESDRSLKYVDIGDKFLVHGKMSKEVMYDYLHLTARGYEIWAEAITPTLSELMGRKE